jgi:hypothetical protein
VGFEFTTLVVIGTDCTGSYKSIKTDRHGITEILLKVALNIITLPYSDLTLLFDIETEQDKLNMGIDWVIKDTFSL